MEARVEHSEGDRQELMEGFAADYGPDWAARHAPGSFGCHELLDRTSLVADMIERSVLSHPACVQNKEWFALAEQAVDALREMYQRIGAAHLDEA